LIFWCGAKIKKNRTPVACGYELVKNKIQPPVTKYNGAAFPAIVKFLDFLKK
jgi:hypothetical protein